MWISHLTKTLVVRLDRMSRQSPVPIREKKVRFCSIFSSPVKRAKERNFFRFHRPQTSSSDRQKGIEIVYYSLFHSFKDQDPRTMDDSNGMEEEEEGRIAYTSDSSDNDDSFQPAQHLGVATNRRHSSSSSSVSTSSSVSSSSSSPSSSSSSVESSAASSSSSSSDVEEAPDDPSETHKVGKNTTTTTTRTAEVENVSSSNNNMWNNQYIGFKRKPIRVEDYERIGHKRQDRSYSDSDNEYEHEIFVLSKDRSGRGIFDMDLHRDGEWGRTSLVDGILEKKKNKKRVGRDEDESDDDNHDVEDIDEDEEGLSLDALIGWAHHGVPPFGVSSRDKAVNPKTHARDDSMNDDNHHYATSNPLSLLPNSPLPLSYLNHLMLQSTRVPEFQEKLLMEKFDTSAIVAIGMILEDILTASLLPLAGCHVLRCRQLESRPTIDEALLSPPPPVVQLHHPISKQSITFDSRNLPQEESPFTAWTLPPEEAIMNVAHQGMLPDTGLPLLQDPVRSSCSRSSSASSSSKTKFQIVKSNDVIQRIFLESTARKDASFLSINKDLLDIFMVKKRRQQQQLKEKKVRKRSSRPTKVQRLIREDSESDVADEEVDQVDHHPLKKDNESQTVDVQVDKAQDLPRPLDETSEPPFVDMAVQEEIPILEDFQTVTSEIEIVEV